MIIEHVLNLVKVVDNKVSGMFSNKELGAVGLSLLHNSFSTLEELTTILITNEFMANYFAFECKGFEFLVERLNTPQQIASIEKKNKNASSLQAIQEEKKDEDNKDKKFSIISNKIKKSIIAIIAEKNIQNKTINTNSTAVAIVINKETLTALDKLDPAIFMKEKDKAK